MISQNFIGNNNNANVSTSGLTPAVGTGVEISGGAYDTVRNNVIVGQGAWGVVTHDYPDPETGPRFEIRPADPLAMYRLSLYTDYMGQRPLHEPSFLILTALAAGPQHGYGIMADVGGISAGRVKLGAGTLYAALDRLRADQLVDVDREEIVDTRLRRYYRLTPAGAERLAAEAARLRTNAAVATKRLNLARGTT